MDVSAHTVSRALIHRRDQGEGPEIQAKVLSSLWDYLLIGLKISERIFFLHITYLSFFSLVIFN